MKARFKWVDNILRYTGKRPRSWVEAWKISVEKWECVVARITSGVCVSDGGGSTCGLCMRLRSRATVLFGEKYCAGCPIFELTHLTQCSGTPYALWCCYGHPLNAAIAELCFLRTLRPYAAAADRRDAAAAKRRKRRGDLRRAHAPRKG